MEQSKNASRLDKMPDEVLAVLYEAARLEDKKRADGVHPDRIGRLVHIPMNKALVRLSLQHIDTQLAFPPQKSESAQQPSEEVPDEIFEAAERLMETTGWSYDDAIREAKRRAK